MKKILIITCFIVSYFSFSQTKVSINYTTLNLTGFDLTHSVKKYDVGFGLKYGEIWNLKSGENVKPKNDVILDFIGLKKITQDFSIGGLIGVSSLTNQNHKIKSYYGVLSTLQLFGLENGLFVNFGYDNTNNCLYGVGYQF